MKKFLSVIMVLIIAVMTMQVTFAAVGNGGTVSPQWTYIDSLSVELTKAGDISGEVILTSGYDFIMTLELQENDGSWTMVDSWTEEGNMMGSIDETCSLEPGLKHRAKVTVKVYNSAGKVIETATKYSATV